MQTLHVTAITLVTALTLLFSPSLSQAQVSWYNNDWEFRKEITIDNTKVFAPSPSTELANFPVLVDVTVSAAQSEGEDILFTDNTGTSKLAHEIESYDNGSGALVAWVKIPNLSSISDTVIYVYYGNLNAGNQQTPTAVWDTNYVMVQHLEETNGNHINSTSSTGTNDGTPGGGVTQDATGQINGADGFDGEENTLVNCGNDDSLDITGSMTVEAWAYSNISSPSQKRIVSKDRTGIPGKFMLWETGSAGNLTFQVYSGSAWAIAEGDPIDDEVWMHVVGVYDTINQEVSLYVDGILVTDPPVAAGFASLASNPSENLTIGSADEDEATTFPDLYKHNWDGFIDEVRVSKTARSAEWIKTSYNNQDPLIPFYTVENEEQQCTDEFNCDPCEKCVAGTCVVQTDEDLKNDCGICEKCVAGVCSDQTEFEDIKNECDDLDCTTGLCDGLGACGFEPVDTTCGDPTATDCDDPDTCDAAGTCLDNLLASGTSCGDPTATDCDDPDTCDAAGTCLDNLLASGTSCGDPTATDCDDPDTCDAAGTCLDNLLASGTSCGDPTATDCDDPDTCDAAGTCLDNLLASGTSCGDPTATDCDDPDTCDAAGTCLDNLLVSGTSCGDTSNTECTDPDTCDAAGTCLDNNASLGTSCGDISDTECTDPDTCDAAGTCLDNNASLGTSCGDPTATDCDDPDTCDADGTCLDNNASLGTSCGDPTATGCDDPDTCDAAGTCLDNLLASGASCGDTTDTDCTDPDTCDAAGACQDNHASLDTPCGDSSDTECTDPDTCDADGTCLDNNASPGDPCDDGLYCTETSQCLSGLCEGSGDPCTPPEVCDEDSLQCVAAAAGSWWNCAWPYRKELTIDPDKVDEDLTNFPVLIDLTDTEVTDNAQMDGIDIVFTDINGTKLSHEIELYDDGTGQLIAWVNVPSVSSTVDTTLFMYFGNADVTLSQEDVEGTWDDNYVMVQHLNETSGDHIDSTRFLNDGTPFVTNQGMASGQIDGADEFDGTDDLVVVPDSLSLDITGSMTVEAWAFSTGGTGSNRILAKDLTGTAGKFILWRNPQGDLAFIVADDSGEPNPWYRAIDGPITDGVWFQVVGVFDAGSQEVSLYKDGVPVVDPPVAGPSSIQSNTETVTIGASDDNDHNWAGVIDEARISSTARSGGWIKTSYNNQFDPASFFALPMEDVVNLCEGNFDCDEDVDGSDAQSFKLDFGRPFQDPPPQRPCSDADPCNGDFDCDGDVDGSDAQTFKLDFARSQFFNPCPPCVEGECCSYQ